MPTHKKKQETLKAALNILVPSCLTSWLLNCGWNVCHLSSTAHVLLLTVNGRMKTICVARSQVEQPSQSFSPDKSGATAFFSALWVTEVWCIFVCSAQALICGFTSERRRIEKMLCHTGNGTGFVQKWWLLREGVIKEWRDGNLWKYILYFCHHASLLILIWNLFNL